VGCWVFWRVALVLLPHRGGVERRLAVTGAPTVVGA
jgi:hypothetical protein